MLSRFAKKGAHVDCRYYLIFGVHRLDESHGYTLPPVQVLAFAQLGNHQEFRLRQLRVDVHGSEDPSRQLFPALPVPPLCHLQIIYHCLFHFMIHSFFFPFALLSLPRH